MATALSATAPRPRPTPAVRASLDLSERARAAEARWRAVVSAQRDDLDLLDKRWPDRTSPECVAARERVRRRAAPGGDADEAMAEVYAAHGGNVPSPVRRRLDGYVRSQLASGPLAAAPAAPPWPERDLAEDLEEPAIVRKARRARRRDG